MHASTPRSAARSARLTRASTAASAALLVAALGLAGCSGSESSSGVSADRGVAAPERADGAEEGGARDKADDNNLAGGDDSAAGRQEAGGGAREDTRKAPVLAAEHVIRTATITVRVEDVPTAVGEARSAAENAGGYIGDETTDRDGSGHEQSRLVLRVPQQEYDEILEKLAGTGKLIERKVEAKDVTDQVVDVESRLKSQQASVNRVRELMEDATQLSDIVSLEGELSTRQAELEALKAQQASLEERTAMATVTLVLSETEVEKKEKEEDEASFLDALAGGWHAFVTVLRWIAVGLGATLPFLAALALLLVLWRALRRFVPARLRPAGAPGPYTLPGRDPVPARVPEQGEEPAGAPGTSGATSASGAPEESRKP
ncbi:MULTISPECIES: DUF4349 domain-containing protein [Streptomyces]|uniref:DUF4349 domain-containing protein n=1 Tax=Streptomyces lycii TaxID=2654337 RepID=A0ABQ7FR49_9ACTN|nr:MULTISPECIES: DUF4349 domain-containing protein [Streptomyces]KAF4410286.1 DUF4349 domain-containing protein [Streptomyces lycii]PGH48047.1 hypothetical protein CRI70_25205 [Streptomyces sp. Ru87]